MEAVIKKIPLDINAETSQQVVFLRHMESGRRIEFILNQSGRNYYVEDDKRAFVSGKRSDDQTFNNAAEVSNGHVFYEITRQNTSAVGTVNAELRILGADDELLISAPFKFEVSATVFNDGDVPIDTPEATALTQLISEATGAINETKASVIKDIEVSLTENGGEAAAAVEVTQDTDGQTVKLMFENLEGYDGRDGVDGVSPIVSMSRYNDRVTITVEDAETAESGVPKEMYIYDGWPGFSPTAKVTRGNKASTLTVTDKAGETKTTIYDGEQGFSPIVNVSKADGVTTLTITDADGAKTAYINDGEKGEAGMDGAPGKDGINGKDGMNGKDGVSPVVSLSKSGAVTTLSVTDASGTRSAQIKDGAKGDRGETGAAGKNGRDGADGAPGKDGADGKNGNAIYAVRSSSTDVIVYFTHDVILNGNIPLQVGDLLLSQYNGNLWQISEITDSTVNAHYTGSTLKGPQGEAGATGADGLNGNSIFIVDASTASEIPGFAMSQIHNGERPVQVGDLLLQSGNGRLNQVTHVLEDANEVICKFTGSILSSGGGTDILNENGVIKQEHLPSGYPYAEPTVFLPETTPIFNADMGVFIIMGGLDADMFIVGQSYTVNWNGTEYVSQATVQHDGSMKAIILGDMVGATQGVPTTGEPFVVMILDAAAQASMGVAAMVIPIDGSASVTLSITGETLTPVDAKFLPNATIFVDVYGTIGGTYEGYGEKTENISKQSHTNAEILALAKLGKNVIIRNYDSETGTAFKCYNLSEVDFNFARFTKVYFSSGLNIGSTIEVLINGTMSMQEEQFA